MTKPPSSRRAVWAARHPMLTGVASGIAFFAASYLLSGGVGWGTVVIAVLLAVAVWLGWRRGGWARRIEQRKHDLDADGEPVRLVLDASYYHALQGRLTFLRMQVGGLIPPEVDSMLVELIKANELGLALEFLASAIVKSGEDLDHESLRIVSNLAETMGITSPAVATLTAELRLPDGAEGSPPRGLATVETLVHEVPALLPLLQEHIDDYEGVLPHLFIADVLRYLAGLEPGSRITLAVIRVLEEEWNSGDDDAQNLISVSFLEDIVFADNPREADLERLLGVSLRRQAQAIRDWKPQA